MNFDRRVVFKNQHTDLDLKGRTKPACTVESRRFLVKLHALMETQLTLQAQTKTNV